MKEFTEDELAECRGKNGNPAYTAYKGKVYDVSGSFFGERGHTKFFAGLARI